jgi:hypothetical protein
MRSQSPAAYPAASAPPADERREPSLARTAAPPRAFRPAPQAVPAAAALPELRAGERVAVLSGAPPARGETKGMLVKLVLAVGGVLALVGAATLVRLATGL